MQLVFRSFTKVPRIIPSFSKRMSTKSRPQPNEIYQPVKVHVPTVTTATRLKAHKYCQEFLRGAWLGVSSDELSVDIISLPKNVATLNNEPRRVVFRIYGRILQSSPQGLLLDSIVFALLSEWQLGPKLYGIFEGGRIEDYIPSRCLSCRELSQPAVSCIIARKMAQLHHLHMPLCKEPKWMWKQMKGWVDDAVEIIETAGSDLSKNKEVVTAFRDVDFTAELHKLRKLLEATGSPVIFCHNDLQEGNILIQHEEATGIKLTIIDFEYCSYNYRGFDLANHFCEWCYDYQVEEPPHFIAKPDNFPSKQDLLNFFHSYINESMKLKDSPKKTSNGCNNPSSIPTIDQLYIETAIFPLASHLLWAIWSLVQTQWSEIQFEYLDYGLVRLRAYFKHKAMLPELAVKAGANNELLDICKQFSASQSASNGIDTDSQCGGDLC